MKVPLYALTSLRFFAALMVFFSHLDFFKNTDSVYFSSFFESVMKEGYIGVTFFFVLSGFILSYACQGREILRGGYAGFLISRVSRIYPLHFITFVAVIPLAVVATLKRGEISDFVVGFIANISLSQAFFPSSDIYFSFNAPSWSLSVELFFYVLFPMLVAVSTRGLLLSLTALVLLKSILSGYGLENNGHFLLYIFPLLRLADFMMGILVFRLFSAIGNISDARATMFQVGSIAGLVAAFMLSPYVAQGYRYDIYYLLPMSAIVLAFAYNGGLVAKILSLPFLVFLGEASFAFYLVHQRIIQLGQMFRAKFGLLGFVWWDVIFSVGYLAVALVVSVILYKFFEIPSKKWTASKLTTMYAAFRNRSVMKSL